MATVDTIPRKFSAIYGDRVIILSPKTYDQLVVWEATSNEDEVVLGILQYGPCCDGWRFAHPDYDRGSELALALGVTASSLPEGVYGLEVVSSVRVTDIREITPECTERDFRTLTAAIGLYARATLSNGGLPEGEAWSRTVVLPAMMAGSKVSVADLRRAMYAEGWRKSGDTWFRSE